ncbi:hypothetical protein JJQ59_27755 [Cupriavidus necator]|uniref:hypothetical protein n=1 Tax=Cupriavidus necator TaxID=106590 RepID=UPI0011BFD264|nr:hypothetical protein [Cupriavidus necator]QQX86572.1 hypothetical protein JJQ59_27755 [Cupriavidus necator]
MLVGLGDGQVVDVEVDAMAPCWTDSVVRSAVGRLKATNAVALTKPKGKAQSGSNGTERRGQRFP